MATIQDKKEKNSTEISCDWQSTDSQIEFNEIEMHMLAIIELHHLFAGYNIVNRSILQVFSSSELPLLYLI